MTDIPQVDSGISQMEIQGSVPKAPLINPKLTKPGTAEMAIITGVAVEPDATNALKKIAGIEGPASSPSKMTREEKYAIEEAQTKRFVLSHEQFAKDRIEGVRSSVDHLQQEHPEILGLTLYGSTVKGTSTEASDIDGFVFVDAEKVLGSQDSEITKEVIDDKYGDSMGDFFEDSTQIKYEELVRGVLRSQAGLTEEQVKHVRIRPVSKRIIDTQIAQLSDYVDRLSEHKIKYSEYLSGITSGGKRIERPEMPETVPTTYNLSGLFHLKVGKGIEAYRAYTVDKLSSMGSNGEQVWGQIIESVESLERNMHSGTQIRYPRTLEEARRAYLPKNNQAPVPTPS